MTHPYGAEYRRKREALIGQPCVWCGAPATTADHVPPLEMFPPGEWDGELWPACERCNCGHRAARAMRSEPEPARELVPRRRDVLA